VPRAPQILPADCARRFDGPPWILGERGSPLEAPENTLAGLARALELGLDGNAFDVRATRDRALVLLADETLERTTSGAGRVGERRLAEIRGLDAGASFAARFRGTRVPLFEEALGAGLCWARVHERGLATAIAEDARRTGTLERLRVVSPIHDVCCEARDAGLGALLEAEQADERLALFVREERLAGCALPLREWRHAGPEFERLPERVALELDAPAQILEACRRPLTAFSTREPLRALALRALAQIAPQDDDPHPLHCTPLEFAPAEPGSARGDWFGSWESSARVRNPCAFPVRVTAGILPRHGAFELRGLPLAFDLAPGEEAGVPFGIAGGAWRPGADPCFFALLRWRRGPGRKAGALLLDAPLERVRTAVADALPTRLTLLRESKDDGPATMLLRRRGASLFVSLESGVDAQAAHTVVFLDGRYFFGARGVRVPLPQDFDTRREGLRFSCGVFTLEHGERRIRRWAGGVPDPVGCGSPGFLFPRARG
jgi:Glycerophosphoryl diester phosphodiesterase family